jgi:hypothetical protein
MPVTYTNRKGVTYTLCQGTTKTGKPRYFFAREPRDTPVEAVPEGYRISESVNGIVSLERDKPVQIPPEEVAVVEATIARYKKPQRYRAAAKKHIIEVYENTRADAETLMGILGEQFPVTPDLAQRLQAEEEQYAQFTAVLRFILVDKQQRTYNVQRWCYRGSIDDWIDLMLTGQLSDLVDRVIPRLGTDDFYEPFW